MREPRDMEGPVEREEALAAKELRKAKAAAAERLSVAPGLARKRRSDFPDEIEVPACGQRDSDRKGRRRDSADESAAAARAIGAIADLDRGDAEPLDRDGCPEVLAC